MQLATEHTSIYYAEVIIPLYLPMNFTWEIPAEFIQNCQVGCRVEVSIKNKRYAGLIKNISTNKPNGFNPKPILNVLDTTPIMGVPQFALWQWISKYYLCTEGEIMQAALPANLKLSSESIISWNEEYGEDFSGLDDKEYLLAEALLIKQDIRVSEVHQILDTNNIYPVIKRLIEKKVCFAWEELKEKFIEKKDTYIYLTEAYNNDAALENLLNNWGDKKAPKQLEIILSYLHIKNTDGEITQVSLLKKAGATLPQLKALVDKGIFLLQKKVVGRFAEMPQFVNVNLQLTEKQNEAFEAVKNSFSNNKVCLLHGVTGSGKTAIYIKLIEEALQRNVQVLYMLPEVALTTQIIKKLKEHFGGNIAVYHYKFNPNERVEIWNKVNNNSAKIIVGARSSLLLPFKNLGLIIVDEEHDSSFKQTDPAPRYNARDAAIYFASTNNANIILGSATPSLESYYNAKQGKYALVSLTERYAAIAMPIIEIIDTKALTKEANGKTMLSPALKDALRESLTQYKQAILFQNRRGYSPYQICNTCGWIPQCDNCDVTLTYHKAKHKLSCHYCGTQYPVIQICKACGNNNFTQKNFGTEQIEESVIETLPNARVARMDVDSVKGKYDHDNLINQFEQQKIDVLVGTQMVVKGLDFEKVNLVGIVDADSLLNFTDFRVNERAFQLMEQVSGRAGRKDGIGKVIIQLANTQHPVLQHVQAHNYEAFYAFELPNRQQFGYPPFTKLIQITCKHTFKNIAKEAIDIMANVLKKYFGINIIGPSEPPIDRIRNQYLWDVLIKLPKDAKSLHNCKYIIAQQLMIIQQEKKYKSVRFIVNVDPL